MRWLYRNKVSQGSVLLRSSERPTGKRTAIDNHYTDRRVEIGWVVSAEDYGLLVVAKF